MPSNTRNLQYARNYEEADYIFGQKPAPDGRYWNEVERPLGTNRQHHYRLEKGKDFYDVCLYHTPMARYWKPEGTTRHVAYTGHSSMTSSGFMWSVLDVSRLLKLETTDGRTVAVPITYGEHFATSLVFVDGKLRVEQSTHPKMLRYVSSEKDKAERAEWRETLQPWLDAMVLRMPEFEEKAVASVRDGCPFSSSGAFVRGHRFGTEDWARDVGIYEVHPRMRGEFELLPKPRKTPENVPEKATREIPVGVVDKTPKAPPTWTPESAVTGLTLTQCRELFNYLHKIFKE